MLTDDQRRQIEMAEADKVRSAMLERREEWGGLHAHRMRSLVDDLRQTLVEEPWFGKSTTERLNDISRMVHEPDRYDLYGKMSEKFNDIMSDFYGHKESEAQQGREIQERELEQER